MNILSLLSLFKKENKSLNLPNSLAIKKLKSVASTNNLLLYENITLYHHTQSFFVPLLLLDPLRGIYLVEHKEWTYDELKKANIQKATNQISSEETLAFERAHDFLKKKFNELTHSDGVPIYNYLLMENLNSDEYKHLDISFAELLPHKKIFFSNSSQNEIKEKLENASAPSASFPTVENIIGNILIQYCIIDNHNDLHLATKEQMDFIDSKISGHCVLSALSGSGKTSCVLLHAILEKLKNQKTKIIIVEPTTLSCDILKKKLLDIIEHAIIELDITSIEILTPIELLNMHLAKLGKETLRDKISVDALLMNKKFNIADIIICDDSDFMPLDFLSYVKHIQKKSNLLLVTNTNSNEETYLFSKTFRNKNENVFFHKTNPHAKAMHIISNLLKKNEAKEILVVSNSLSKEKLKDDLESFIRDKAVLLDSSQNLIDQDLNHLLLATYMDINGINAKFVILLDVCFAPRKELKYAFNLCEEAVYVLYEDECEQLNKLRNNFEDNKN